MRDALDWVTGGMKVEFALMGGGGFMLLSAMGKGKLKFCERCWSDTRLFSLLTCELSGMKRTMLPRRVSPPA